LRADLERIIVIDVSLVTLLASYYRQASCSSTLSSTTPSHPSSRSVSARGVIRREDAERFVEEVCAVTLPKLASYLRIEERELEAGGSN
jgi:hypothetical protein